MRELRPGAWHWPSAHPEWNEEQWWPELVSSCGIESGDDFLLFDPLAVPEELRERARAGEGEGHFQEPGAWPFGITAYAGREDNDRAAALLSGAARPGPCGAAQAG